MTAVCRILPIEKVICESLKRLLLAALPLLAACDDPPVTPGPEFGHYLEQPSPYRLVEVLAGRSNGERRTMVAGALKANGIPHITRPYSIGVDQGANVIAEYGDGGPLLILTTHFDRVPFTPGANDNASCVAAAVKAYGLLTEGGPVNHITVRFLFTDQEENGLLGAIAHMEQIETGKVVLGVASFKMCGMGESFGIWDVEGSLENSVLVRALTQAGAELDIYNGTHGTVAGYGSDHRAFALAGIPAVGVTVSSREDEARLREYVDDPNSLKWRFRFLRPAIFRTYHTAGDTLETIDPAALDMTARVMAAMVRNLDRLVGG